MATALNTDSREYITWLEISDKVYHRFVSKVYHPKGGV
jgi:hypothetical protein